MEQAIPIEECAKQRLQVLIYSYTLFTKYLMEEGVDRAKVQRASDKVWATLGIQAAETMKPMFGDNITIEAIQQAGSMAEAIHGMEVEQIADGNRFETDFVKCPWQDAGNALNLPDTWRFCTSGHVAFTQNMYKGLNPNATYELVESMPAGAATCKAVTKV